MTDAPVAIDAESSIGDTFVTAVTKEGVEKNADLAMREKSRLGKSDEVVQRLVTACER